MQKALDRPKRERCRECHRGWRGESSQSQADARSVAGPLQAQYVPRLQSAAKRLAPEEGRQRWHIRSAGQIRQRLGEGATDCGISSKLLPAAAVIVLRLSC